MFAEKQNANPTIYNVGPAGAARRESRDEVDMLPAVDDEELEALGSATGGSPRTMHPQPRSKPGVERIDSLEVFDLIRGLHDPEHPLTLEQLKVATLEHVRVDDEASQVHISFTPTIPHCSMATLIGLCIRVKLLRSLPRRFKVHIKIAPGTHASEAAVNKQLNDKERVAAALENAHLLEVVNKCIAPTLTRA